MRDEKRPPRGAGELRTSHDEPAAPDGAVARAHRKLTGQVPRLLLVHDSARTAIAVVSEEPARV
ncbi:hypothetical protein GCM10023238_38270 [Streptomyces heliomycini]